MNGVEAKKKLNGELKTGKMAKLLQPPDHPYSSMIYAKDEIAEQKGLKQRVETNEKNQRFKLIGYT